MFRRTRLPVIARLGIVLAISASGCSESSGNGDLDASDGATTDARDAADGGAEDGTVDGADPLGNDGGMPGDGDGTAGDGSEEEDPWAGCPNASDYLGGGWNAEMPLEVTGEATYCFTFDSTIAVEEQIALKNMVRFHPGTYGLPAEAGAFELTLPACVRQGRSPERLNLDGPGSVAQEVSSDYFMMDFCQPLRTAEGNPWYLRFTLSGNLPAPGDNVVLGARSLHGGGAWIALQQDGCNSLTPLRYQSCHYDWIESRRHLVRFEGGEVTLTLKLPQIDATVYGLFTQAGGSLDGIAFEQQDYWNLAFYSMLHFFYCDFIVLFDEPIAGACGIKIDELLIWGGTDNPERRLELIDCDLYPLEERVILSAEQLP